MSLDVISSYIFQALNSPHNTPRGQTAEGWKLMEHHETVREVYRECVRNHSLRHGACYTIDGCCKFIPADGDDHLQCGACGCHRNFHRADYCIVGTLPVPSGRRRPRARFTEEQKQSMARYAKRIGWRVPRGRAMLTDEAEDQFSRFCREIGVSKQAFKVWMHNHKGVASAAPEAAQVASYSEATTSSGAAMDGGEEEEVIRIGDEAMEEETKDLD